MRVFIYERGKSELAKLCEEELLRARCTIMDTPMGCDIGVAPWLNTLIPQSELDEYGCGVLIFHPSLLPVYRGKTAIRDAFKNGDKYTGATWFWANSGYDKGLICEQMVIEIAEPTPREFYEKQVVPAGCLMFKLIIKDMADGYIRRRPYNNHVIKETK